MAAVIAAAHDWQQ